MIRPRTVLLLSCLLAAPALAVERFAVVIGNNEGAPSRNPLWYAERDAERMARALIELGNFSEGNVRVLKGGGAAAVREEIARTEAAIAAVRAKGSRALLLFFFSGHADADALELGRDRLRYTEVRGWMQGSAAEVKLAVVDACQAGGLTQVKGARPVTLARWELPATDAVQGVAFIASTAVGELAQESAFLGGSFFTHHFEMAMRGGGDTDGDGQVTLTEAFKYASNRTVSGTATTQVGAQHPTYEVRMSGRGDVVLTDLRSADARLLLPGDAGSTYILRGPAGIVAEVPGTERAVSLALPAGDYQVERRRGQRLSTASLKLVSGGVSSLPELGERPVEVASRKGGQSVYTELFVGGVLAREPLNGGRPMAGARVGGRAEALGIAWQLRADLTASAASVYGYRELGAAVSALWPLWRAGPVRLEAGPELGGRWATQTLAGTELHGVQGLVGGLLSASVAAGPVRVGLQAGAGAQLFVLDQQLSPRPDLHLSLGVAYGFGG